jgi:hypothetical protein
MGTCQVVHWATTALLGKVTPRCLWGWKDLKSTNQHCLVFSFYALAWSTRVKTAKYFGIRFWVRHSIEVSILLLEHPMNDSSITLAVTTWITNASLPFFVHSFQEYCNQKCTYTGWFFISVPHEIGNISRTSLSNYLKF